MDSKRIFSIFPFYRFDENQKRKLHYMSFKFLCLSLYVIGFYYVFLNNSLENGSLENVKNSNLYKRNLVEAERINKLSQRKKNSKHKKENMSKTKYKENNNKCNEQNVDENKHSINPDLENSNIENESNISISNINYNDISKQLTESELREVLNSLKECPSKEELRNLWTHTVGVSQEGFDDIPKELKGTIQRYLVNDIYVDTNKYGAHTFLYDYTWKGILFSLCRTVASEEIKYTKRFLSLINDIHTLDDILKFIYSFLEYFNTLKKELHKKYEKELLQKISIILNENY